MSSAHTFAQQHVKRFEQELVDLLKIPSVSTLKSHAAHVDRAADWIVEQMQQIGLDEVFKVERDGVLPLVYGAYMGAGAKAPTVLIYTHYDVQPADVADGWHTDPFEPVIEDGRIYARGAVDSKCHVIGHLKAIESLLASEGGCPVNVKFLFEGEEESGSAHIYQFIPENLDLLKADVCVISDGGIHEHQPILTYGLRGIITTELVVTGPQRDLHSGQYGGVVHNPLQALVEILAQLHDEDGHVTVPGFYDTVREIHPEEHAIMEKLEPHLQVEWHNAAKAPAHWGEPGFLLGERIGARPTLEINGIAGGFYGEGFKTVLPHKATAKISCRLVPDQDPIEIFRQLKAFIAEITPPTVRSEIIELEEGASGILVEVDNPMMQAVKTAYERGWGKEPILARGGGSVPVVSHFQQHLQIPVVMIPFGINTGAAHGPNEHTVLEMMHKGIATVMHFYELVANDLENVSN